VPGGWSVPYNIPHDAYQTCSNQFEQVYYPAAGLSEVHDFQSLLAARPKKVIKWLQEDGIQKLGEFEVQVCFLPSFAHACMRSKRHQHLHSAAAFSSHPLQCACSAMQGAERGKQPCLQFAELCTLRRTPSSTGHAPRRQAWSRPARILAT
jgi:hypothetical protein